MKQGRVTLGFGYMAILAVKVTKKKHHRSLPGADVECCLSSCVFGGRTFGLHWLLLGPVLFQCTFIAHFNSILQEERILKDVLNLTCRTPSFRMCSLSNVPISANNSFQSAASHHRAQSHLQHYTRRVPSPLQQTCACLPFCSSNKGGPGAAR